MSPRKAAKRPHATAVVGTDGRPADSRANVDGMTFGSLDEAIEIANETPYGLQGAAFTSSLRNAFLLGEGIRCGTVLINESNNYWDQLAPFGGMKKSGLGRELSNWILAELTEIKQISIDIAKVRE